jgi:hypothetical protein
MGQKKGRPFRLSPERERWWKARGLLRRGDHSRPLITAFEQRLERAYRGWVHTLAQEFSPPGEAERVEKKALALDRQRQRGRRKRR